MAAIPHITEGMTWQQAFGIINRVIDKLNALDDAVGGALVDGRIDYTAIVNRPTINGVEIVGNLSQDDLSINAGQVVTTRMQEFENRMTTFETNLSGKVASADIADILRPYARTADLPDISGLATKQELTSGLSGKVSMLDFNTTVTNINTTVASKASSATVYTKAQVDGMLDDKADAKDVPDMKDYYTKREADSLLDMKQNTVSDLGDIRRGATAGMTAYQKPVGGIPKSDLVSGVQTSLGLADTAYQKPNGGIPKSDLVSGVQTSLGLADSAYQMPKGGIPEQDLVVSIQTSLSKADTAYQKPGNGIPNSDLNTNLGNMLTLMETKVTQAGNSAAAAAGSETRCNTQCDIATQKAQEAATSAQSVSGAISRINALEKTVNGDQQTTGLARRTSDIETKIGNMPKNIDITTDLKETREKSNEIIQKLQDDYNMIRDVDELVIAT